MNFAFEFEMVAYEHGEIAGVGALVHADKGTFFPRTQENPAPMFDRGQSD